MPQKLLINKHCSFWRQGEIGHFRQCLKWKNSLSCIVTLWSQEGTMTFLDVQKISNMAYSHGPRQPSKSIKNEIQASRFRHFLPPQTSLIWLFLLLMTLLSHQLSLYFSNTLSTFLPSGSCTSYSLCLEHFSPSLQMSGFLSFRAWLKCHLLREPFPYQPIKSRFSISIIYSILFCS